MVTEHSLTLNLKYNCDVPALVVKTSFPTRSRTCDLYFGRERNALRLN